MRGKQTAWLTVRRQRRQTRDRDQSTHDCSHACLVTSLYTLNTNNTDHSTSEVRFGFAARRYPRSCCLLNECYAAACAAECGLRCRSLGGPDVTHISHISHNSHVDCSDYQVMRNNSICYMEVSVLKNYVPGPGFLRTRPPWCMDITQQLPNNAACKGDLRLA